MRKSKEIDDATRCDAVDLCRCNVVNGFCGFCAFVRKYLYAALRFVGGPLDGVCMMMLSICSAGFNWAAGCK
jgi:hypothetical protein